MVGPTLYLIRAASATVASVWLRNTTTVISDSDAARTASGASSPSVPRRLRMIPAMTRAPVSSAATAIKPCGASVAVSIATMIAIAAEASRLSAMARSTSAQVTSTPRAISGSGRRPLLNGSQAATKTAPAVNTATRLAARPFLPGPSRRSTKRLMSSQQAMPARVAGNRIQTLAVLIWARCASSS